MRNLILPPTSGGQATALSQRHALAAHEQLDAHPFPDAPEIPGLRRLIRESWQRSARLKANPDNPEAPLPWTLTSSRNTAGSTPWRASCP
ncbi:hypothetical protein AHiyo4_38510 [Arthrobacter sp. Hiyo4]|nr:hypothetical protein AHiyo4_38510 [Arthrobacter sp. Hiyo4]